MSSVNRAKDVDEEAINHLFNQMLLGEVSLKWDDIQRDAPAINHLEWQRHRVAMKGVKTEDKMIMSRWWLHHGQADDLLRVVQVTNYINALKRGGQLSKDGAIQK